MSSLINYYLGSARDNGMARPRLRLIGRLLHCIAQRNMERLNSMKIITYLKQLPSNDLVLTPQGSIPIHLYVGCALPDKPVHTFSWELLVESY